MGGGEKWVSGDAKDEVLDWHHYNEEIFDFNRDGSRYEDEGGYLYRLASGKKFHWLEDPTKTIYTVEKATQRSNRVRTTGEGSITDGLSFLPSLFRNSEGDIYKHAAANLASRMAHPLYYTGENFSKSNIATFSPAMTNWEPTNYDNGGVGPISWW